MKRVFCVFASVLCCWTLVACAESNQYATNEPSFDEPSGYPMQPSMLGFDEETGECGDIAVAGDMIWRCKDENVLCEDPSKGETVAKLPLADLLEEGESCNWKSIVSWDEDSVLLCLCIKGDADQRRVALAELACENGKIVERSRQDSTQVLGFLFPGDNTWIEVNAVSASQRLLFAALDQDFQVHFASYEPSGDSLSDLGERSLSQFRSMVAYKEGALIVEPDEDDESIMRLSVLSLSDGAVNALCSVEVDSTQQVFNFAYDDSEELLYFTVNNIVHAVKLAEGESAKPVGRLDAATATSRFGALVKGQYACNGSEGQLLVCELGDAFDLTSLRVADMSDSDVLNEATSAFSLGQTEYDVSAKKVADGEGLVASLKQKPTEYDAFVVRLGSDVWQSLVDGGYVGEIDGGKALSGIREELPSRMQAALDKDGSLLAIPIATQSYCQTINVKAIEDVIGLARDEIPTDWAGFLTMLAKIAESGALVDNGEYSLYEDGIGVEQFRQLMLQNILQDAHLWATADASHAEDLSKRLTEILREFNKVDWTKLGLPDDTLASDSGDSQGGMIESGLGSELMLGAVGDEGVSDNGNKTFLLSDSLLTGEVLDVADGTEFWPLSIDSDGERLIGQDLTVVGVNPKSTHHDAVVQYLQYVWDAVDPLTKIAVSQSFNEAIPNDNYDEDCAYHEQMIAELEQALSDASDPAEKEALEAELEDIRDYAQKYAENAKNRATEESIADYRSFADQIVPVGEMVWDDMTLAEASFGFLDGTTSQEELIDALLASMN